MNIMHIDVTRAFFCTSASRDIYVKLPAEDQAEGDEQLCGKLKKTMYGARDAAQNWQNTCSETVREVGFETGKVSPCHLYNKSWDVCGMVLGGDFVFVGARKYLAKIANHMKANLSATVAVTERGGQIALRVLNRNIRWTPGASSTIATTGTRRSSSRSWA